MGCAGDASPDTLVGWAVDGVPIHGPLTGGTKAEVDAALDSYNGRAVGGDDPVGYRYHSRTRERVDE
eukprot:contig_16461_g3997